MWLTLCLMGVAVALDPATTLRKSLNPYVLYNFLDADANGPSTTTAGDVAGHPTVNFGSLNLGPRASWLVGRPGVRLARETSSTISSAMSSQNTYQLAWTPQYFNTTPFVIEIWYQFNTYGTASLWSIARGTTVSGTQATSTMGCTINEPLMDMVREFGITFRTSVFTDANPNNCFYSTNMNFPQSNVPITVALYVRYDPVSANMVEYKYEGTTLDMNPTLGKVAAPNWKDTTAKLLFSSSNNWGTMDFNVLSYAIYPDFSNLAGTISSLFQQGLPNAKPVAPSFQRSVPETIGGSIKLCPNINGTARDSDCMDFSNNATGLGQTHSLSTSASLSVYIMTLPSKGTLSENGVPITQVPFKTSSNHTVYFTPVADATSWYATYSGATNYTFVKLDYTSFTYMVVDPDGASSNNGTVTLEVYPVNKKPFSADLDTTQSLVYAGRTVSSTTLDNGIFLLPQNTEFIPPSATDPMCTPLLVGVYTMCTNYKGYPADKDTVVTIKSLPAYGVLKYRNSGVLTTISSVGTQIPADTGYCPTAPACAPAWIAYYEVPLSGFNSTSQSLATATFSYTATTTFDLAAYLGNTRYIVDTAGSIQSVGWSMNVESNVGTVTVDIKNGFYSSSGFSSVKQHNMSVIVPQTINLFAADLTVSNPVVTLFINSLPWRGALFDIGSTVPISTLPHALTNFSVAYQPSLPSEPYGFIAGINYANFTFYASSGGKTSNIATQTINVDDTNDQVDIKWYSPTPAGAGGIIPFKSQGLPQSWSDLPDNNLYINWTDPDLPAPGEPYYKITIQSSDFQIFIEDSMWRALQEGVGSGNRGQLQGAGAAGAGNGIWQFIVNRTIGTKAVNPIRLRPNKNVDSSVLSVTISDCQFVPGITNTFFQGNDWQPLTTSVSILLSGALTDKKDDYQGVANPVIEGVIIGVASFVGLIFLICGYFLVRWCCRRRGGGGGGGGGGGKSTSSKSGGSTSAKKGGKGKKAKSAYLHQVEL